MQKYIRRSLHSSRSLCAQKSKAQVRYNYNTNPFDAGPQDEDSRQTHNYPMMTAKQLARYKNPPRRFKCLARDWIDDCLYNPHYGYFTSQVRIFDPSSGQEEAGFDFENIKDGNAFNKLVAEKYQVLESEHLGRQTWHTPTELFKPWYARAVARFLAAHTRTKQQPLVIYELGAGTGAMMRGILDHLASEEPDVYTGMEYNIIEISPRLAKLQRSKAANHIPKVKIHNKDVHDWNTPENRPCFVLSFEVLDNFAHDILRYTYKDQKLLQCHVTVSDSGDFSEEYIPVTDPEIASFVDLYSKTNRPPLIPPSSAFEKLWREVAPFQPNMSPPIWIPTRQLSLLRILAHYFPQHDILWADFDALPDAIDGTRAPVVQTRYEGATVAVSTYLVQQGFFDIFFPTDFDLLAQLYQHVCGKGKNLKHAKHAEFLNAWAEVDKTTVKSGENVMLDYYANASFAWTEQSSS